MLSLYFFCSIQLFLTISDKFAELKNWNIATKYSKVFCHWRQLTFFYLSSWWHLFMKMSFAFDEIDLQNFLNKLILIHGNCLSWLTQRHFFFCMITMRPLQMDHIENEKNTLIDIRSNLVMTNKKNVHIFLCNKLM